jgi:exosortase E/protease (VPEID-CTERM system)
VTAVSACFAGTAVLFLWASATGATFRLAQALLYPVLPGVVADPANLLIGTARYSVQIAPTCSGLEGVGLILVFAVTCLALFRDEFRFPHALLLVPAGMVTVFALNSLRIAALVLIGNAGAEQIAERGFHSQAGWMAFCLVAVGLSLSARKIPWLNVTGSVAALPSQFENPATRWLLPLVISATAGMISTAGSGNFEWLYPLRFFAVVLTLVFLWRKYSDLDLSVSWWAPAIGSAVFLVWIGLDRFSPGGTEAAPRPLLAIDPLARTVWLIFRVLAATVTAPIAEELAFRGFLYRRLLSPDFENVSSRHLSWIAMLIASLAFGLLHGDRWFVGFLAGALYTLVLIRRGSMGDAIVAHATTNALLAVDVLAFHRWHLW